MKSKIADTYKTKREMKRKERILNNFVVCIVETVNIVNYHNNRYLLYQNFLLFDLKIFQRGFYTNGF